MSELTAAIEVLRAIDITRISDEQWVGIRAAIPFLEAAEGVDKGLAIITTDPRFFDGASKIIMESVYALVQSLPDPEKKEPGK